MSREQLGEVKRIDQKSVKVYLTEEDRRLFKMYCLEHRTSIQETLEPFIQKLVQLQVNKGRD